MMCPDTPAPYLMALRSELEKRGVAVRTVLPFGRQWAAPYLQLLAGRATGFKLLHVHWLPFRHRWLLRLVLRTASGLGIRIVATVHNLLPHEMTTDDDAAAMAELIEAARVAIVHTDATRADAVALYGSRTPLEVIPHGNLNHLARPHPREESRARLNVAGDFLMVSVGQMRPYKGLDTFVDVLRRLPSEYAGLVAGKCLDPDIRRRLRRARRELGARLITRFGHVPDDELSHIMSAADLVLLPYTRVTTSGAAFLAFAYRKALMTRPLGDLRALIRDGVNGYLCDDAIEMADRIRRLTREDLEAAGRRGHEDAGRFLWSDAAERTLEAYRLAAGER